MAASSGAVRIAASPVVYGGEGSARQHSPQAGPSPSRSARPPGRRSAPACALPARRRVARRGRRARLVVGDHLQLHPGSTQASRRPAPAAPPAAARRRRAPATPRRPSSRSRRRGASCPADVEPSRADRVASPPRRRTAVVQANLLQPGAEVGQAVRGQRQGVGEHARPEADNVVRLGVFGRTGRIQVGRPSSLLGPARFSADPTGASDSARGRNAPPSRGAEGSRAYASAWRRRGSAAEHQ
jgi:hypothetical protein